MRQQFSLRLDDTTAGRLVRGRGEVIDVGDAADLHPLFFHEGTPRSLADLADIHHRNGATRADVER